MITKGAVYPYSIYDATNLLTISHEFTAVPLDILQSDIELLLSTYLSQKEQTFDTFDNIWDLLKFDYIHLVCLQRQNRENFMNTLYQSLLDHFDSNLDNMKFGVIYALYFLFCSQPSTWETHHIRVTKDIWIRLFDFYILCCKKDRKDYAQAAMIFKKLKDDKDAFVFVAQQKLETPNILEKKEKEECGSILAEYDELYKDKLRNDATSICYGSDSTQLGDLLKSYQYIKELTYSTSHATLATQQWLKEHVRVVENNLDQLQKVMIRNVLIPNDQALNDSIKETGRSMWEDRAIKSIRDLDTTTTNR